jgi:hypothetical protein
MTTVTNLTADQASRITKLTGAALSGFQAKFERINKRLPDAEEIKLFTDGTFAKIIDAVTAPNKAANEKAERLVRHQNVLTAAKAAGGVKFFHRREEDAVETIVSLDKVTNKIYDQLSTIEFVPATLGGETFAYKYVLDENNDLFMVYTTAFCRADEPFDPLIGMEIALDKFVKSEAIRTPIQHERFGQVKLTLLAGEYRRQENLRKEAERDGRIAK